MNPKDDRFIESEKLLSLQPMSKKRNKGFNKRSSVPVLAMGIALAGIGIFGTWPIVNANPVVPELVLKKARNINISESSIQGTSAYLRPMRCAGVNKVAIRLVAIRAGNTDTLWDGTHQRPEGAIAPSASCLLTVLLESGITSKEPNPTVSFQFGKTEGIRSGKKQSVRLPDLATPESWATKEAASKPILADRPVVLYARAAGSKEETERVYDDFFKTSSVEEVVGVSKKHGKLTFLVVTFTWSAG
jgi:hypothetical protein